MIDWCNDDTNIMTIMRNFSSNLRPTEMKLRPHTGKMTKNPRRGRQSISLRGNTTLIILFNEQWNKMTPSHILLYHRSGHRSAFIIEASCSRWKLAQRLTGLQHAQSKRIWDVHLIYDTSITLLPSQLGEPMHKREWKDLRARRGGELRERIFPDRA